MLILSIVLRNFPALTTLIQFERRAVHTCAGPITRSHALTHANTTVVAVYSLISDQLVEGKQTVVSKQGAVSQFRFAYRARTLTRVLGPPRAEP